MRPFTRPQYHSSNPNDLTSSNALLASGYKVKSGDADAMRRLMQDWQERAFGYYNIVPEIKYATQFYARLSVLRLYVGERQDDGTIEESKESAAIEQLQRMRDPGGSGYSGIIRRYGQLRFLIGECYLVATADEETPGQETWEVLSSREFKPDGAGRFVRTRAPGLTAEAYVEVEDDAELEYDPDARAVQARVYRLWRPHPEFSERADSTMQGVLDVCEELVLLTQAVRARARSRLAGSGILLVNGRFIPVPPSAKANPTDPNADPFMRDFTKTMTSSIVNEGAASAVVPHVVRIDVPENDTLDNVMKHIQIIDPLATYPETGLRYELIKRLAIGLDMPAEILLGISDTNHWNAWQVDEQTWKAHLQPVADEMVADFTTSWFQPTIRDSGIKNWERLVVYYDATQLINHPDRSKDAKDLHDRGELSGDTLREATGFNEQDAPSEEERNRFVGIKIRDGSLAVYGIPSLKTGGIEPSAGEVETTAGTNDVTPSVPSGNGNGNGSKEPPSGAEAAIAAMRAEASLGRVLGACDVAFHRARDLAGSRLRNYARRNPDAAKVIDGIPNRLVASTLGSDLARGIGAPNDRALVAGAAEILAETLRTWGIDDAVAGALGDRLEQFAARTLYDERPGPLPAAFTNYVVSIATATSADEVPA